MMLVVDARRIESTAIIGNGELRQPIISLNRDLDVLRLRVPPRVAQRLAHNVLGLRLRHPRHRQHENERLNVLQHGQLGLHARFIRGHDRIKVNKESCGGVVQFARLRRGELRRNTAQSAAASSSWARRPTSGGGGGSIGLVLSLFVFEVELKLSGLGLTMLGGWLLRYDIARHTIMTTGLTRYIAACLLPGYVWLIVGGALWIIYGGDVFAGLTYDALLPTLFVGFIFSMIFGHAPIIVPAVMPPKARRSLKHSRAHSSRKLLEKDRCGIRRRPALN